MLLLRQCLYGMYIGQDAFRVALRPKEVRPQANLIDYRLVPEIHLQVTRKTN